MHGILVWVTAADEPSVLLVWEALLSFSTTFKSFNKLPLVLVLVTILLLLLLSDTVMSLF